MDKREARDIVNTEVALLRDLPYERLLRFRRAEHRLVTGPSGTTYLLETESWWDDSRSKTDLRVSASIQEYPPKRRLVRPVSEDFIVSPDGKFVGEGS